MACTNLKLDKVAVRKMMTQRRNDLNAKEIIAVSYTHLTLPTNREV